MTNKTKSRFRFFLAMLVVFVTIWSCQDEEPSLEQLRSDKLAYIRDSVRISDSLRLTNNAGVVNYAITVIDGSTSTIYQNSGGNRSAETTSAVQGAIVTISQFGKTLKDTTDDAGLVVFNGFFRSAVNITIRRSDFTTVSYVAAVGIQDSTRTGTISFVGNLVPIFPLTGNRTATVTGRATVESDLTNRTRETVPDGTSVVVSIDATEDSDFSEKYLTGAVDYDYVSSCGCEFIYVGRILQASYSTGVVGTTTNGNYTITVPSAVDGLPLKIDYSDVALDQRLFETSAAFGQRTITNRTIFRNSSSAAALPPSSSVSVSFVYSDVAATASAVISANAGTIDRINVTNGGTGYTVAPIVQITGGGGTNATATATLGQNGRVASVTIVTPGSGYTSAPTVTFLSGAGGTASATLAANGTVTGVVITNSGFGYTTAPVITFSAPGGTGTTATGTAVIDSQGRVTSVNITNAGSGYTTDPTVSFTAAPVGGTTATGLGTYSGQSVGAVQVTALGSNYFAPPTVTFSTPQRTGVRATANAIVDPNTRELVGIVVTNAGSGYTLAPTITISAGSGAAATALLTGGSVISANITAQGANYVAAPLVVFDNSTSGGSGATGVAVMANGKVVGIDITNGGTGYISPPTITLVGGDNANAFATIVNGGIAAITVTDGGRNFAGAPRVVITSSSGGGATATATVVNGQITAVAVNAPGTGYLEGNTPSVAEGFSSIYGREVEVKPGLRYINDIYYGTGTIRQPN